MIKRLSGKLLSFGKDSVIVEVGGVGFFVFTPPHIIEELKSIEHADLWTYLAVRENALDLYGFISREDLDFFELLITISGIGPKSALNIMSISSAEEIRRAVYENNPSYLTQISGIGKKTAQKIVLELKDKIPPSKEKEGSLKDEAEAIEALTALGYSTAVAREVLKDLPKNITETSERVRAALKKLGS